MVARRLVTEYYFVGSGKGVFFFESLSRDTTGSMFSAFRRRKKESTEKETTNTTTEMTSPPLPPSSNNMLQTALDRLSSLGINCLALDFDQTIIDIHTGGRWPGTAEELIEHVRPEFWQLLNACCSDDNSIHVMIVTFSKQPDMIRSLLQHVVTPPEAVANIPIRGGDRSWRYNGVGSHDGKQAHIASAVEELLANGAAESITKQTTLLIDDDRKNIQHALKDGTRAVWFNPNKPHRLWKDLVQIV